MPGLFQLFENTPMLQMSPGQQGDVNLLQSYTYGAGTNPLMRQSANDLKQFAGSPGQPSSATQASLKEFNDLQTPGIMNNAASMGLGNSGAALEAISQGQEQALVPFMQQDLQNSLTASQGIGQLGQEAYGNRLQGLEAALQASGMQNQNLYNQQEQQWGLGTQSNEQIMQLLGNLFGNKQHQSQSGFDWSSLL